MTDYTYRDGAGCTIEADFLDATSICIRVYEDEDWG